MPETLVTPARRAAVVNWLVRVADGFKFPADTLHLAVSYVDRFLSVGVIVRKELQLLAVAAMLLAA
jgi:cyclin A